MSPRTYQRRIQALQKMIAEMLWVQPTYNGSPSCAYCGEQQHLHRNHCAASQLVATRWPEDDLVRQNAVRQG